MVGTAVEALCLACLKYSDIAQLAQLLFRVDAAVETVDCQRCRFSDLTETATCPLPLPSRLEQPTKVCHWPLLKISVARLAALRIGLSGSIFGYETKLGVPSLNFGEGQLGEFECYGFE